ncbi:hypothetical protein OZX67_04635 [Bifidobacterium sp. ESL0728]|uniref:hypothetical protein n=1 Tax=Bifidobacterium sp. ESL0728 TaxID=2983220 RepID=UPI0023F6A4BA|nr:hypothetical protein [Bifidobacterium sp. ESL0728]WEV59821.1 hypothetical protein OZX67_04635 [Bifidobacterium sp. ESL0728]
MAQEEEKVDSTGDEEVPASDDVNQEYQTYGSDFNNESAENKPAYDSNDRSTWDYIPFKDQLTGVAIINMIEMVMAVVLTWLLCLLLRLDAPVSDMLEVTIVGGLIAAIPEAAVQTAVSKRERTWASHNWGKVIANILIYCVVLLVTAYLVNHQGYWYAIVIVATLFDAFMGVWSNMAKPEPGMSEKDSELYREAELKKYTDENFGPEASQREMIDRYNKKHGINKFNWHRKN